MSDQSITEFTCRLDARGFLNGVSFVRADGTVVDSGAPAQDTDENITQNLNAGEKIKSVSLTEYTSINYRVYKGGNPQAGNDWNVCQRADE
jgi:V8-like Glu-specific endopeptidase